MCQSVQDHKVYQRFSESAVNVRNENVQASNNAFDFSNMPKWCGLILKFNIWICAYAWANFRFKHISLIEAFTPTILSSTLIGSFYSYFALHRISGCKFIYVFHLNISIELRKSNKTAVGFGESLLKIPSKKPVRGSSLSLLIIFGCFCCFGPSEISKCTRIWTGVRPIVIANS